MKTIDSCFLAIDTTLGGLSVVALKARPGVFCLVKDVFEHILLHVSFRRSGLVRGGCRERILLSIGSISGLGSPERVALRGFRIRSGGYNGIVGRRPVVDEPFQPRDIGNDPGLSSILTSKCPFGSSEPATLLCLLDLRTRCAFGAIFVLLIELLLLFIVLGQVNLPTRRSPVPPCDVALL